MSLAGGGLLHADISPSPTMANSSSGGRAVRCHRRQVPQDRLPLPSIRPDWVPGPTMASSRWAWRAWPGRLHPSRSRWRRMSISRPIRASSARQCH